MKILLTVELYNPHKGGAEKVVEDLAKGLVEKGHDVTVATTYMKSRKSGNVGGVKIEQFKIKGNQATGIRGRKKEIERYRELVLGGGFDVVFNYTAQSWPTDLTLPLLNEINAVKILAPVGYSRLTSARYKMYFNTLPVYLSRYDKLVYHSDIYQDKIYGDENGLAEKAVVIHNGALKSEFVDNGKIDVLRELGIKTKYLLLNVSHHNFAKGHMFSIRAFRKMNRDDATLLIIGDRFASRGWRRLAHFFLDYIYCFVSSLLDSRIKLANDKNREFAISAYKSADLYLNGSMLECAPLVMYESFASRTPFITTDVGNVREHEKYLRIVESPREMAKVANELLDDDKKRTEISESAFELWRTRHRAEEITDLYERFFKELYESRSRA